MALFLVTSDIHYNDWNQFNKDDYRLKKTEDYLETLIKRSHKESIPILIPGDFFHTPSGLSTKVFFRVNRFLSNVFWKFPKALLVGIDGNHDTDYELKDYREEPSLFLGLSYAYPDNIKCINFTYHKIKDYRIYGIPYLPHNLGFKKIYDRFVNDGYNGKKILLIHTDLLGAKDPSGYEVKDMQGIPTNIGKFFKPFKLVLCGHIHRHGDLHKGRIFSVGAPNQQRKSDVGCTMGYLEIDKNLKVKVIPSGLPEFRLYHEGDIVEDDGNFWVKLPQEKKALKREKGKFRVDESKVKLAKRYCKKNGIVSKKKIKVLVKVLNKVDEL